MIRSIADTVDWMIQRPDQFPLGRAGVAITMISGTFAAPIVISRTVILTAQIAKTFFGETAGLMTIVGLLGGFVYSVSGLQNALEGRCNGL